MHVQMKPLLAMAVSLEADGLRNIQEKKSSPRGDRPYPVGIQPSLGETIKCRLGERCTQTDPSATMKKEWSIVILLGAFLILSLCGNSEENPAHGNGKGNHHGRTRRPPKPLRKDGKCPPNDGRMNVCHDAKYTLCDKDEDCKPGYVCCRRSYCEICVLEVKH